MSITSGFFNSIDGDRKYDARQMSSIFSGVINDGVFMSIGTAFTVNAGEGNTVTVGIGKAWFNDIWVKNDAVLPMTLPDAEILLNRYDAIVIEVDDSDAVRDGTIKIITGDPASNPARPTMVSTLDTHQYPLAYIYRAKGSTAITQADITSMIGTSSCPYITGILETLPIDNIVAQWQDEWAQWRAQESGNWGEWMTTEQNKFYTWKDVEQTEFYNWRETEKSTFYAWRDAEQAEYEAWMTGIHDLVDGETASNLASKIVDLQNQIDYLRAHVIVDSEFNET